MLRTLNKKKGLFIAISLAMYFLSVIGCYASELPDIGDSAGNLLSVEQEKRLGKEFMINIRQNLKLVDDPVSNEYIQSLGHKLASQIDTRGQSFEFFIVDDPNINAFAGPAGYIGIHTGLIKATDSESELASVMAHEIAHVVQRHLVRQFESGNTLSMTTMAAIIAAILLGKGNPDISQAVVTSSVAGSIQQQLSFSRAYEQEADRVGMEMLAHAGYNPHSMADFFETLQNANRYNQAGVPEFILTHPVTASRIADTRNRAMQMTTNLQPLKTPLSYKLFQARINFVTTPENPPQSKPTLSETAHTNDYSGRYEQILFLLRSHKRDDARREIQHLIKDDKYRIPYIITQAEIEIDSNNIESAAEKLAQGLILYPQNQTLSSMYAEVLIKAHKPRNAMLVLQGFIRNKQVENPRMYKIYANAADQANYKSEAYEAMAEYYYQLGQTHTAIQHIEQALAQKDTDAYQKLRLETQLQTMKQEMIKNQAADKN